MGQGNFYFDVMTMLEKKYDEIGKEHPKSKKAVFGHSLGAEIGIIFAFRRELACLLTAGGPLNYFSVRFPNFGKYPEATLRKMVNFLYKQDLINGPVRKNPNYNRPEVTDVVLPLYNPWLWRPTKAHMHFFNDERVHKGIANVLINL